MKLASLEALFDFRVAPYVGAWIETIPHHLKEDDEDVAPYVGAWIETSLSAFQFFAQTVAPLSLIHI